MRLRTFTAESIPKAFALVKAELGEDAIILSTEEEKDGTISVTAAMDPDAAIAPSPAKKTAHLTPPSNSTARIDALRYDLQHCLRFHNVPELFISKMTATLNDATLLSILAKKRGNSTDARSYFLTLALEELCRKFFQFTPRIPASQRLMIVGTSGIGKTLAVAKLATHYRLKKLPVMVITTDLQRAGGVEQLQSFTDILDIPLFTCADKKSLSHALKKLEHNTTLLIDTAGCNPYDDEALQTLKTMATQAKTECALVIPGGMDAQESLDITEMMMALPITQLIASRTDCARRFGSLLATAAAYELPFSFESNSASVAKTMPLFTPEHLAQHLVKYL